MMASDRRGETLMSQLPAVRGRYQQAADLAKLTWFRVGGPAEVLFRPADLEDLQAFLACVPSDIPVTVFGVGSNILVRDGGIPGVVIRLTEGLADIAIDGTMVTAGAGASNLKVANAAQASGVGGLEFLCGIPGSIGGALRMNAGAYGREISDVAEAAGMIDPAGRLETIAGPDLGFTYRHCGIAEDRIFVSATLRGEPAPLDAIAQRMRAIQAERGDTQPTRTPTGGSTFLNPPGEKAWELIEGAGCRGLRRGGAMVSEKHCNFLINEDRATAADLEGLGEEVRRRVFEKFGIELEWEIRRIGVPAGPVAREVAS